ncbi:MAG: hypothetical protein JNM81_12435, partial [Rhodospirillaceae bacterium]|nr:hypothetical protein [Rhodospirillaceae bacterium]
AEKTSIETFETLVAASHGVHFINVGENNKWSWAESKVSIKDNVVLVRNFGFRGDDRVFAVGNNGSFDTLCQWTSPADQDEPLSAFAVNSDNASTDIEDKVLAYRDTLRTMLGAGDPCGGTIGTEYTLLANGNQAARQALTQPWALGAHWPEARGIEVYLRWWSAQGLWERKLFRAYNAQRPLAQKALEKHYASSFGMAADDATALAATALDAILSHYISVSSEEPYATDDELRLYISDLANPKSDKKKISAQLGLHAALVLDLKPSAVLTRSCS